MFSSTRLPRRGCDVLHKAPVPARHVVVLRREHFWSLPVFDAAGEPLSVGELEAALEHVCEESDRLSATSSAGSVWADAPLSLAALTTMDRDSWADAREVLEAHSLTNQTSLATIDEALFALCLDARAVDGDLCRAVRQALAGNSTDAPRWHDKAVTLMITADGIPLGQFEHSWGDGISVLRMVAETFGAIEAGAQAGRGGGGAPTAHTSASTADAAPTLLPWDLPAEIESARRTAAAAYEATCTSLRIGVVRHTRWGARQLKEWGVSPDGTIQAALQLAFHRVAGRTPATYESASTSHFSAGRTETIRSATGETAAFVAAVTGGLPVADQTERLRAAAARHAVLTREAAEGKGFDRHLFALRALAPSDAPFFADATYAELAANELSTSVLTLKYARQSSFGPVHPQGYGVSYHVPANELHFCTTAYAPRCAQAFCDELEAALAHVEALLSGQDGAA